MLATFLENLTVTINNEGLLGPFTIKEFKIAMFQMATNIAAWLNGYSLAFS